VPDDAPAGQLSTRRVGPIVLLGLRPRFVERALAVARDDERFRALSLWGSLARGDADEWSDVDFVATVKDESVPDILDELGRTESLYGRSLISLQMPQDGVDGGGVVSVTYLQSGLPLHVDWYICPLSVGVPVRDTKPLFTHERWSNSGTSFADLLRDQPSQQTNTPADWDLVASMTPILIKEVARGRPEVVVVDGKPLHDQIDAYDALARRIAELPSAYSDMRPALFYHLGVARRGC
jgi:predicted nucleotidyltransferase